MLPKRSPHDYKFDYASFNHEFPNRVVDDIEKGKKAYIDVLGNRTWNHLHKLAHHYGCPACRGDMVLFMSAVHDLKNIELGKKVYDRAKFKRFKNRVDNAYAKVFEKHNGHGYSPEEREPDEPYGNHIHEPEEPEMRDGHAEDEEEPSPPPYVPDEEFKRVLPVTPDNVLKAISHYEGEYRAPSSLSDLSFILSIPHGSHTDKEIDRALKNAPYPQIEKIADTLVRQGYASKTNFGGYILTDAGRNRLGLAKADKRFNIEKGSNFLEMKEVGLITGAQFAGEGVRYLANWYDTSTGANTRPLHLRVATYLPLIGVGLMAAAYKVKALKKGSRQLGSVVLGANLLAYSVPVASQLQSGATFGFVPIAPTFTPTSSPIQPGLTLAPTPGYNPMIGAGLRSNVF